MTLSIPGAGHAAAAESLIAQPASVRREELARDIVSAVIDRERLRTDALTAAAEIVLLAERIADDPRHRGTRATAGRLTVHPGNITTIPGKVSFSIDLRDVDSLIKRQAATVAGHPAPGYGLADESVA